VKKNPPKRVWVVILNHDDDVPEIIRACETRKVALREARSDREIFGWKTFVEEYQLVASKTKKIKR
jgi:hypothetical protein